MGNAAAMVATHPRTTIADEGLLARVIEELTGCFQTCTACADACLAEQNLAELVTCIRVNADCASICLATVQVLSRHGGVDAQVTRLQVQACAAACTACGEECARHADMHEHCRVCAQACRACAQACEELLAALP